MITDLSLFALLSLSIVSATVKSVSFIVDVTVSTCLLLLLVQSFAKESSSLVFDAIAAVPSIFIPKDNRSKFATPAQLS